MNYYPDSAYDFRGILGPRIGRHHGTRRGDDY
jgi:hypothetical protein